MMTRFMTVACVLAVLVAGGRTELRATLRAKLAGSERIDLAAQDAEEAKEMFLQSAQLSVAAARSNLEAKSSSAPASLKPIDDPTKQVCLNGKLSIDLNSYYLFNLNGFEVFQGLPSPSIRWKEDHRIMESGLHMFLYPEGTFSNEAFGHWRFVLSSGTHNTASAKYTIVNRDTGMQVQMMKDGQGVTRMNIEVLVTDDFNPMEFQISCDDKTPKIYQAGRPENFWRSTAMGYMRGMPLVAGPHKYASCKSTGCVVGGSCKSGQWQKSISDYLFCTERSCCNMIPWTSPLMKAIADMDPTFKLAYDNVLTEPVTKIYKVGEYTPAGFQKGQSSSCSASDPSRQAIDTASKTLTAVSESLSTARDTTKRLLDLDHLMANDVNVKNYIRRLSGGKVINKIDDMPELALKLTGKLKTAVKVVDFIGKLAPALMVVSVALDIFFPEPSIDERLEKFEEEFTAKMKAMMDSKITNFSAEQARDNFSRAMRYFSVYYPNLKYNYMIQSGIDRAENRVTDLGSFDSLTRDFSARIDDLRDAIDLSTVPYPYNGDTATLRRAREQWPLAKLAVTMLVSVVDEFMLLHAIYNAEHENPSEMWTCDRIISTTNSQLYLIDEIDEYREILENSAKTIFDGRLWDSSIQVKIAGGNGVYHTFDSYRRDPDNIDPDDYDIQIFKGDNWNGGKFARIKKATYENEHKWDMRNFSFEWNDLKQMLGSYKTNAVLKCKAHVAGDARGKELRQQFWSSWGKFPELDSDTSQMDFYGVFGKYLKELVAEANA